VRGKLHGSQIDAIDIAFVAYSIQFVLLVLLGVMPGVLGVPKGAGACFQEASSKVAERQSLLAGRWSVERQVAGVRSEVGMMPVGSGVWQKAAGVRKAKARAIVIWKSKLF